MRFVFVTDEAPVAGLAGHLAFNEAVLNWLRIAGHEVVILLVRPRLKLPVQARGALPVEGPGLRSWGRFLVSYRPADIARILARLLLAGLPAEHARRLRRRGRRQDYGLVDAVLGAFITAAQSEWCARRIADIAPDAVLVDTIFRAPLLTDDRLAGVNRVILAHDVLYLRHRALASAGYQLHPASLPRETETALLESARHIVAIQPEEADELRRMCPAREVHVAPMPAIALPRPAGSRREANRLVFVGSDTLPNLDGLRWFFAEIWPRLIGWHPELRIDLIGGCGPAMGRLPDNVVRPGAVRQLSPWLHRASLAISPLRVGSGLKIKLLDYARHGLTTVATPVSLRGFARDPGAPFITAPDAASFSLKISQFLQQSPEQAEQSALDYVANHYGTARCFSGLARALELPVKLNAS